MTSMRHNIAAVFLLLLLSSGWLEVAMAREEEISHDYQLNRTLIGKYGGECDASALSIWLSSQCDVMDDPPNAECCDSIFATLGRKNCLCKVVVEPNYRSSSFSGANVIVDMYYSCNGGPYVSPTSETDCEQSGRKPLPIPPQPLAPPRKPTIIEGDLIGRLSFWRKVGWTACILLVLVLLGIALWIMWKKLGCSWFHRRLGFRLGRAEPEHNCWSYWTKSPGSLRSYVCVIAHDIGERARGWWASMRAGREDTRDAQPHTWNVMNIFICKITPRIKEGDVSAGPGTLELPTVVSPEGNMALTGVQVDGVDEAPGAPLLLS